MSAGDRERWNERHAAAEPPRDEPAIVDDALRLTAVRGAGARALDLACGLGASSLALARRGFAVTAVDVSDVALARLGRMAADEGLDVTTVRRDLELEPPPGGPFEAVVVLRYRQPSLWPLLPSLLAPGGVLVVETFTRRHSQRTGFPERFALEPGELARIAEGLDVLLLREDWDLGALVAVRR